MVLCSPAGDKRVLVIKSTNEVLLASKLCKELLFYLVPFSSQGESTVGLVTAIFDDPDEPLFIGTPLIADSACEDLRQALLQPEIDIHFFDGLGRELLGYKATMTMPLATRAILETVRFFPATAGLVRGMWNGFPMFMGERTEEVDVAAIKVSLSDPMVPEDLFIMELRPDKNAFHGSPQVRYTSLLRPEPGRLQEWDIIDLLQRTFDSSRIFHGPLKVSDREEIADVVVVTDTRILVVQAKDSPNTEDIISNKLSRKRATALKNMRKALRQVRGAASYLRSASEHLMMCNGKNISISTKGKELVFLVVIKELFSDQYDEYSKLISNAYLDTGFPCIALDYMELTQLTSHVLGEESIFEVLHNIHVVGQEQGKYPRPRFGLAPSVPYTSEFQSAKE